MLHLIRQPPPDEFGAEVHETCLAKTKAYLPRQVRFYADCHLAGLAWRQVEHMRVKRLWVYISSP